MRTKLLLLVLTLITLPAFAADRCLVLGDSIAQGVAARLPECDRASKVGISSGDALKRFPVLPDAEVVVISLGSNDAKVYPFTKQNIQQMRWRLHAPIVVIWILPAKPSKHAIVQGVAKDFGDRTLTLTGILSTDGVHPTIRGYAQLATNVRLSL